MANVFTAFGGNAQLLAQTLFLGSSGISLVAGSVKYTGVNGAASTFDSLLLGTAQIKTKGLLLTSGDGTPPITNTSSSYGVQYFGAGDADLTSIIQNAFPNAGATNDASVLEFKINAAKGVKSIMFDVIFGSDEFPEFSNSTFVDIAAILVNGKNAAFFAGKKDQPLSILDKNLGYFQDNAAGGIPIEYDGISNKLTVIASVKEGVNTIKIAVADTGDYRYDSGIFVANLRGSDKELEGIVNEILGTDGNDKLKALKGIDNILIGDLGKDKLTANNGFDIFYGDIDPTEPETGIGPTGKSAVDEVAASTGIFKDTFIFKSVKHLKKGVKKTDVIADWDKKDKIDFSKMTKKKFEFLGKDKFEKDGDPEIYYKALKNKGYSVIYGDTNGDGKTDFTLKVLGVHKFNADDFVL